MQHPSESTHGKNSARLLPLVLDNAQIFIGEKAEDFELLRQKIRAMEASPVLVYPSSEGSTAVFNEAKTSPSPRILLLLDGTWRKALKMYHLNPWLHALPRLAFKPQQKSGYLIRQSSRSDSLSTLEAAVEALQILEPGLDTSPLLQVFDAMVARRLEAMPHSVRVRYQQNKVDNE